VLALEKFKMSLLRSLVCGCPFFYKDAAPTELTTKFLPSMEWLCKNPVNPVIPSKKTLRTQRLCEIYAARATRRNVFFRELAGFP